MIKDIVARRYAKALIASIKEKEALDKIGEELKGISSVIKNSKELQNFFFNPAIPFVKKEMVLKEILNLFSLHPTGSLDPSGHCSTHSWVSRPI